MQDVGIGAARRAPPSVLRRLMLGERIAARAASRSRLADAAVQRRLPKLLRASTRLSPPIELRPLVSAGASRPTPVVLRATRGWPPGPTTPDQRYPESGAAAAPTPDTSSPAVQGTEAIAEGPFKAMLQQNYGIPDDVFEAMFGSGAGGSGEPVPAAPPPVADPANEPPEQRRAIRGARILEGPTSASDLRVQPAQTQRKRLSPRQPRPAATPPPRPTVADAAIASSPSDQDQTTPATRTAVSSAPEPATAPTEPPTGEPKPARVGPSATHGELRGSAAAPPTGTRGGRPADGDAWRGSIKWAPRRDNAGGLDGGAAQGVADGGSAACRSGRTGRSRLFGHAEVRPHDRRALLTGERARRQAPPHAALLRRPRRPSERRRHPTQRPRAARNTRSASASDMTPGSTPSPPPADRGSAPSAPAASVQGDRETAPSRQDRRGRTRQPRRHRRPPVRRRRQRARRPGPCCGGRAAAHPRSERTDLACNEPRGPPSIPAPPTPSPARGSRPARTFARRLADAVRRGRGRSEPAAELPAVGVGSSTGTARQRPAATSAIELARRPSISAPRDPRSLGDEAAAPPSSAPAAEVEEPATERSSAGTTPASPVQRARETSTDSSPEPVAGAGQPAASDVDRAAPAPAGGTAPDPTPRSAPSTAPDPGPPARMRLSRVKRGSVARPAGMPATRPAAQPPPPGESPSVAGSAGERAQPSGGAGVAVVSGAPGGAPTAAPTRAAPAEPEATSPAGLGHVQPGLSDAGPRPTRPAGTTTAAPSRAVRAASAQPGPPAGAPRPRPFIKRRAGAEPVPAAPLAREQRDPNETSKSHHRCGLPSLRRPPDSARWPRPRGDPIGPPPPPPRHSDPSPRWLGEASASPHPPKSGAIRRLPWRVTTSAAPADHGPINCYAGSPTRSVAAAQRARRHRSRPRAEVPRSRPRRSRCRQRRRRPDGRPVRYPRQVLAPRSRSRLDVNREASGRSRVGGLRAAPRAPSRGGREAPMPAWRGQEPRAQPRIGQSVRPRRRPHTWSQLMTSR